jgi:hypothetical protein
MTTLVALMQQGGRSPVLIFQIGHAYQTRQCLNLGWSWLAQTSPKIQISILLTLASLITTGVGYPLDLPK